MDMPLYITAIMKAVDALKEANDLVQAIPDAPMTSDGREADKLMTPFWGLDTGTHGCRILTGDLRRKVIELEVNLQYRWRAKDRGDAADYEVKKQLLDGYNSKLRPERLAPAHPESGEPCLMLVVASRDGTGRYVLENRHSRKRSHASRSLLELLPLKLTADVARKEGVIERRRGKGRAGSSGRPR